MKKNMSPFRTFFLKRCLLVVVLFITGLTLLPLRPARADAPLTTIPTGDYPRAVAVNPATNKIYVANSDDDTVAVIDGATNVAQTVSAGDQPYAIVVNPITNKVYVGNQNSDTMTVIIQQPDDLIPLTTSIGGLPNRTSTVAAPEFIFTTESAYSPVQPPVQQLYYQVDTRQGAWRTATLNAGQWQATLPKQSNGLHILYAYAEDGQLAGSVNPSPSYSPIPGRMSAYLFLVAVSTANGDSVYLPIVVK